MAATPSVDMKIKILKKSMSTFSTWLDSCDSLIKELPLELEKSDSAHIRELVLKYKDLLLQMKERCEYMQKVNSLCKDVEKDLEEQATPTTTTTTGWETAGKESDNQQDSKEKQDVQNSSPDEALATSNGTKQAFNGSSSTETPKTDIEDTSSTSKQASTGSETGPGEETAANNRDSGRSPTGTAAGGGGLDPQLIDLATQVKDLNVRFATTCMHAKEHYASLSKVLSEANDKRASVRSSSVRFNSSNQSHNGHYVRVTGITERRNPNNPPSIANGINSHSNDSSSSPPSLGPKPDVTDGAETGFRQSPENASNSAAALSHNTTATPSTPVAARATTNSLQGVARTSKASVLPTEAPISTLCKPALSRSLSAHRASDLDRELARAKVQAKYNVVLRSKSVDSSENYSDSQPRSKLRPKSAVVIQPNADGETALLSEIQLRKKGDKSVGHVHRRSMEINLASLSKSGVLSSNNIQQKSSSPASYSPNIYRASTSGAQNQSRKNRFSSSSTLPGSDRFSVTSVESLDPRTMISGQLQRNSHAFNMSIRSDGATGSSGRISGGWSPERHGVGKGEIQRWNGGLLSVENGLQGSRKRSVSMDIIPMNKNRVPSLSGRLREISGQLQEFIHKIAESRKCALQSLELELHLGELKAMSSLLEFHDFELTRYSATFSPSARDKLQFQQKEKHFSVAEKTVMHSFSEFEINSSREDLTKLRERVGLLRTHCDEAIEQTEEVLEFVMQYEREVKQFKQCLNDHTHTVEAIKKEGGGYSEVNWIKLSEAFTDMTEQKTRLQSICELSTHLLYLESIFCGAGIREELSQLKAKFQKLVVILFSQLEEQAKSCAEQLLLEMSVLGSWVTETELAVQALTKKSKKPNGFTSKLTDTRANLLQEVKKRKAAFKSVSDKLEPILLVLNPDDSQTLRDLIKQLDQNSTHLVSVETTLQDLHTSPQHLSEKAHHERGSIFRSLYSGKKQDKVQDKRNAENRFQDSSVFQDEDDDDSNDETSPYARIDNLRRKILRDKSRNNNPMLLSPPLGKRASGQGISGSSGRPASFAGHGLSFPGRDDGYGGKVNVPSLYEHVEDVVPSPFLDPDMALQVPSRPIDVAIEQLPHQTSPSPFHSHETTPHATPNSSPAHYATPASARSAVRKLRYTEIDVSNYDNPRLMSYKGAESEGGVAMGGAKEEGEEPGHKRHRHREHRKRKKKTPHEEILAFVGREWKDLTVEVTPTTEDQFQAAMDKISDTAKRDACKKFLLTLQDMDSQLKAVKEQVSVLQPPQVPDLEKLGTSIDQCRKLRHHLDKLHPQVESYNEQCLEMTLPLSDSAPRAAQLVELRLFDVSTLWHMTNIQVATCMRELRERESSINSLHRQLHTLSRMLNEARVLLEDKQNVLDIEEYLKKCETMHAQLISKSDKRAKVAADIKESILHNPQAQVCQELLDQLKQVETEWLNVSKELSAIPSLQPLLVKRMVSNGGREAATLEVCVKALKEERGLDVERATLNKRRCQECVQRARKLDVSLDYAEKQLESYSKAQPDTSSKEDTPDTAKEDTASPSHSAALELSGVKAASSLSAGEGGEELGALDHKSLLEKCSTLKETSKKIVKELDDLYTLLVSEAEVISRFHKEYEELNVWLTDTKGMLEVTGSPTTPGLMGVPASPAQLRGKHQAICQQVVTRQPKMETLHTLASELLQIPAGPSEKLLLENKIGSLCADWDELCQQCVPAGVLPLVSTPTGIGGSLKFQPPSDFEDISQMLEWLMMIESKLQPHSIVVGDFMHLKKTLSDLRGIERELKLREKDYKRFMSGIDDSDEICSLLESDKERPLSTSNASLVAGTTVNFSPSKSVKFHDENTLQRNLRQKEIQSQVQNRSGSITSSLERSESDPGSIPYHSVGPAVNGNQEKTNGAEDSSVVRTLKRMTSDPEGSLSRLVKSMGSGTSPMAPISEEHYHLSLLWRSIWTSLLQQRDRLQATQERWKCFESKKEEFSKFLTRAEDRMAFFFRVIGSTKNFGVIQTEMAAQKTFEGEFHMNEQRLTTLNNLSHELITQYHKEDDTGDLKDTMADLNQRWKKMAESFTPHQPSVAALGARWGEFYREYLSFEQCFHNLDIEMSNLNPFVHDLGAVKTQLDKLKLVEQELKSREGTLENIRLLAMKLVQGVGGNRINSEAVHAKLDNMTKRWNHLQSLATERKSALESALSEKQDFLSHLADCLAWLTQAEKHLRQQKPLGADFSAITAQHDIHQEFWREVQEQRPKMESVITSGRQVSMERHWPQETADSVRSGYSGVESRWKWVWSEAAEWGQLLEIVLPEVERFQSLCTDCGKKLSEAEMTYSKFGTVSRKIPTLKRQLDTLQIFETKVVSIGETLNRLVTSQKRQLELGVRKSAELIQLVKGYHGRWSVLKEGVDTRKADTETAMVKYDPANIGTTVLPQGWIRRNAENNVPYYINTNTSGESQWVHPELQPVYLRARTEHTLSAYPSIAYPMALRLRTIQRNTQLSLLQTRQAMEAYKDHAHSLHPHNPSAHSLSPYDTTVLVVDIFQKLEDDITMDGEGDSPLARAPGAGGVAPRFHINSAVELTTCWVRDIFDGSHVGLIKCSSLVLAVIAMSSGRLEEKYRALFEVVSGGRGSISMEQLIQFMEQMIQIPQFVCGTQFCSLHAVDVCARECFKKFVGVGRLHLPQFIAWLQLEPPPLSWLPVLHRLAAAEASIHDIKCSTCKTQPIVGFRYRCIQCHNLDMCQTCYWSGKSIKSHDRTKHFMEEYCLPTRSSDEMKDIFKSFQRTFSRRKKQKDPPPPTTATLSASSNQKPRKQSLAPSQVGLTPPDGQPEGRRRTWSNKGGSPPPLRSNSMRGEERHPGRRFTVTEDMKSAWMMGGAGGRGSEEHVDRAGDRFTSSLSMATNRTGLSRHLSRSPLPPQDMEASMNKLAETTRNLSDHLKHMKDRQATQPATPSPGPGPLTEQELQERPESPQEMLLKRNTSLQGRVKVLQEHNRRLESCISQLKLIAEARQQQGHTPPPPGQQASSHGTPHLSPIHASQLAPSTATPTLLRAQSTPASSRQQNHAHTLNHTHGHSLNHAHDHTHHHGSLPSPHLGRSAPSRFHYPPPAPDSSLGGRNEPPRPPVPPRSGQNIPLPQILLKQQSSPKRTLL